MKHLLSPKTEVPGNRLIAECEARLRVVKTRIWTSRARKFTRRQLEVECRLHISEAVWMRDQGKLVVLLRRRACCVKVRIRAFWGVSRLVWETKAVDDGSA